MTQLELIQRAAEKMQAESDKLTIEMKAICAKHPECGAPEYMSDEPREQYNVLWGLRRDIYNYQSRMESIANDFSRFYTINLS